MKLTKVTVLAGLAALVALALVAATPGDVFGQAKAPPKAKDEIVFKGGPLGAVKMNHKMHAELAGVKCETCHHPPKPEKPAADPNQACSTCHARAVTPPMKTTTLAAFHKNAMAAGGLCVDCHKTEKAKGKATPMKCADCHKK